MNRQRFLYLIPPEKSFYKIRNERFIINALKDLSHDIIEINKFYTFNLIRYCSTQKIDGIIFNSLKIGMKCEKFLNLNKYNIPKYWWYFDAAKFGNRYSKVVRLAKEVDIFFNKEKNEFENYTNMKINPIWLDQGVPSNCKFTENNNLMYDLGFFGSASEIHSNRTSILRKLDKKYNLIIYSKDYKKFIAYGFKNCYPAINQEQISKKVSEIKITLCFNSNASRAFCWSDRIHLMLGSGAFCLAENIEGIQNFYKNERDCIFFNQAEDLMDKIDTWLNSNKKNEIRKNGYNTAHKKNSYQLKVEEFLTHIEKYNGN